MIERASTVPGAIKEEETTAWLRYGVVLELAERGEPETRDTAVEQALQDGDRLTDTSQRTSLLGNLAVSAAQAGRRDLAVRILDRSRHAVDETPAGVGRVYPLATLATSLAKVGETRAAAEAAHDAAEAAAEIANPSLREQAQRYASWALAKAGQYDDAVAVAHGLRLDSELSALVTVAITMATAGHIEGSLKLAHESSLGDFENWPQRDEVLAETVVGQARRGRVKEVLNGEGAISQPERRARALSDAATELARVGQLEGPVEIAGAIEDDWLKGLAEAEMVPALARSEGLESALLQARQISHPLWNVVALGRLAREVADTPDRGRVAELVSEAFASARAIADARSRAAALSRLAEGVSGAIETGQARALLCDVFTAVGAAGREFVLDALRASAALLATLDRGETLWQISRGVVEVETWWGEQT